MFLKAVAANSSKNCEGFTLMEIMVASAIFAVVVSALMVIFNYTLKINRRTESVRQASQGMRNFIEFLVKEVRNGQIDFGVVSGQTLNSNAFYSTGPCKPPATGVGGDTYLPQSNRLAVVTLEGDYECFYLAEGPGNTDGAAGANLATGLPLAGASPNSLVSNPGNPKPVLAMKKSTIPLGNFEILSPPNVSVQRLSFIVRPMCDPYSSGCTTNAVVGYPKIQPFVTIIAQFQLDLPTGEVTTIYYQTSVSTNKYDIPNQ